MAADCLEEVLEVVRNEIEPAKDEEDGHRKPGQDLGTLQAERMADAGTTPDLKVAQHVDHDTHGSRPDVEEDEVGQSRHGQRSFGTEEDVHGHSRVAAAPPQTGALVALHAGPGLLEGGYGEGRGEDGRRSWWWFLEDLMLRTDGAVFVAMAAALANVLEINEVSRSG